MDMPSFHKSAFSVARNTDWITQMKGAAMVYIIVFHWFGLYTSGIFHAIANAGAQGNHIFFTLSAFGLYMSFSRKGESCLEKHDWMRWFARRVKKLLIPYYISVVIIFASIFMFGFFTHEWTETLRRMRLNPQTALATIFLYRNFVDAYAKSINTPWWFAITILQLYLLFPILCKLIMWLKRLRFAILTFLVSAIYIFIYSVVLNSKSLVFHYSPLQFLFSFSLGIILCDFFLHRPDFFFKKLIGMKPIIIGVVLEVIGVYLATLGPSGKEFNDLFFAFGIFILTFNLVELVSKIKIVTDFFSLVGKHSLSLFLLHAPFIYLIFPAPPLRGSLDVFIYFAFYVVLLVGITWSSSKFVFDKIESCGKQ